MTFTSQTNDGGATKDLLFMAKPPVLPPSPQGTTDRPDDAEEAVADLSVRTALNHLADLQVDRTFWIKSINRQENALGALVRMSMGWNPGLPEAEANVIKARAARIVSAALGAKEQAECDVEFAERHAGTMAAVGQAIAPMKTVRHQVELEMQRIVRALPIWKAWAEGVRGLGQLGLAVILAETGDLSGYPKKGHVWKRLGLAPFEGQAYSTWRRQGGLSAAEWTNAGYSPRRRAEIYACVSESLLKAQIISKAKSETTHGAPRGPYGEIYIRRREHLETVHPDWTPKHCQMDAMRVMTKYLLRDLWREWNRLAVRIPMPLNGVAG